MLATVINRILAVSAASLALAACSHTPPAWQPMGDFEVTCHMTKAVAKDSATLLLADDDYDRLRLLGGQRIDSAGTFTFRGQTSGEHVAVLRFSGEKRPFCFVLGPGATSIVIDKSRVVVTGSSQNHDYMACLKAVRELQRQRRSNFAAYCKEAADSTLNAAKENRYQLTDHRLADSIQSVCLAGINAGSPAAKLIGERCMRLLTPDNLKRVAAAKSSEH